MAGTVNNKEQKAIYFVGILAWLIPGAGHWLLGLRRRGVIIFVTICATFLLGVTLGSIEMIDPYYAKAWYCAQVQCGLPAIIVTMLQNPGIPISQIYGRGVDIGQVYAGVAGLLNLLCVMDALFRNRPAPQPEKTKQKKA